MAFSKIILNNTTLMDVTQKTVTAGSMLSGTTALKNDGTDITGNITTKTSANMSASGATVTAPAGYYASDASKSVASGSEGTPTATKGTVSNHVVTVTPSVTNTAGYISGGTHTGTGVSVSVSELESGTKEITSNGTGISVSGYSAVDVAVSAPSPTLETVTKSYTPTESQQTETITPGTGYDGIGEVDVTVGAISSSYVGSGITRRDSTDLSTNGATVSVPSGYYANNASKIVGNGTVTAPSTITGTSASVSAGTNTLTLTKTVSVTPNVTTAGYISSGTAGNSAVSLTASVNTRSSSDLTANNLTVTAPSGYYGSDATKTLTDANLLAGNIKKNISIFGVTGTLEGGGGGLVYESGTYTPTSDINKPTISFTNTHSEPPIFVGFFDANATASTTTQSGMAILYFDFEKVFGYGIPYSSSSYRYVCTGMVYRGNSSSTLTNALNLLSYKSSNAGTGSAYPAYYCTNTGFYPYPGSTSRYWRAGRTYKWIAVWAPTT